MEFWWVFFSSSTTRQCRCCQLLNEMATLPLWFSTICRAIRKLSLAVWDWLKGNLMSERTKTLKKSRIYKSLRICEKSQFKSRAACGERLDQVFNSFDLDGSGEISRGELRDALRLLGFNPTEEEVNLLLLRELTGTATESWTMMSSWISWKNSPTTRTPSEIWLPFSECWIPMEPEQSPVKSYKKCWRNTVSMANSRSCSKLMSIILSKHSWI